MAKAMSASGERNPDLGVGGFDQSHRPWSRAASMASGGVARCRRPAPSTGCGSAAPRRSTDPVPASAFSSPLTENTWRGHRPLITQQLTPQIRIAHVVARPFVSDPLTNQQPAGQRRAPTQTKVPPTEGQRSPKWRLCVCRPQRSPAHPSAPAAPFGSDSPAGRQGLYQPMGWLRHCVGMSGSVKSFFADQHPTRYPLHANFAQLDPGAHRHDLDVTVARHGPHMP